MIHVLIGPALCALLTTFSTAGAAFPFGYGVSHDPYPVAGIGLSWRLLFD